MAWGIYLGFGGLTGCNSSLLSILHSLAAYPADRLYCVDLLFVGLKLRTLRAIVIGAEVRLCHTSPAFGYKNSTR